MLFDRQKVGTELDPLLLDLRFVSGEVFEWLVANKMNIPPARLEQPALASSAANVG